MRTLLPTEAAAAIQFHLFEVLDSTNRWLKELPISPYWEICLAEEQRAGYGRFGNHWYSPPGQNIYLSIRPPSPARLQPGLSQVICLAVYDCLRSRLPAPPLQVKWPNDIYWHQQKLGGCLLELVNMQTLVIGIGLNINSLPGDSPPAPERPWTSLKSILDRDFDRNPLVVDLIQTIRAYCLTLEQRGFGYFLERWQTADCLMGQTVRVKHPAGMKQGKVLGLSLKGELILQTAIGELEYLSAGEVSIGILDQG